MIRVYALSGSHGIGKTTTWKIIKKMADSNKFAFVGEVAHGLLVQMGIRDSWKEKIFGYNAAYQYFENALDFITIASYLVHQDKPIIADRSLVDNAAYRLCAKLPLNTIHLLDFHAVKLFTFFMRSPKREDATGTDAVRKILTRFKLPYEEIFIREGDPEGTAHLVLDRVIEMEEKK